MSVRPSPGPSVRLKPPQPTVGITAGAEDAKYQTKYRELKRKVKEIEIDNDKLHFKVLQAKRSIQRMKLERAILYERLAATPSPTEPQNRVPMPPPLPGPVPPPFSRSHSGSHHFQDIPDDAPNNEYSAPRIVSAAHTPRALSPPPSRHDSRHPAQHLPPPPLPNARPHVSPTMHHTHSSTSHERTRSQSRSRAQQQYLPAHPYPEALGLQQVLHSPPPMQERERERPRRHESHDGQHGEHSRLSAFMPRHSPPPGDTRRVHPHPHPHLRVSPAPPGREEYDRRELDQERSHPRDLGRTPRDPSAAMSPPLAHRNRQAYDRASDYPEPLGSSHARDEPAYYDAPLPSNAAAGGGGGGGGGYPSHSRSGSPVSGAGSGNGVGGADASRSDSRHYYDSQQQQERTRGYTLRPVNPPNEEMDFVHEDGRSRDRGGFEASRKRGRSDMEEGDDAGDYQSGRAPDDRGKRYHREHRRSIDNQDADRMGPTSQL
ncbi:hypothetical protein H0H87_001706 [Tephrocybe sp. NHM501043]|nr:hypothetical protein H0H87_001706 [Tephrocybe sp. NHM501043]